MNSTQILWLCLSYAMIIWFCSLPACAQLLQTLRLDVANLDVQSYMDFIEDLRKALRDPNAAPKHGYAMMRNADGLLLVELSNGETKKVTFLLNIRNAYILAYRVENHVHYFTTTPERSLQIAFPGVPTHTLPFKERYDSLEPAAGKGHYREQLKLGKDPLRDAISLLYQDSRKGAIRKDEQARPAMNLIICIQMISEAARNYIIAGRISSWIHKPHAAEADMVGYETDWGKLSKRIQAAGEDGVFAELQMKNRKNGEMYVSNVNDPIVRSAIALVLYDVDCNKQKQTDRYIPLLIRSVVPIVADNACTYPKDPKVSIYGPNGLCAGLKEDNHKNGKEIVLQHCRSHSNSDEKHLWSLKMNGMIQSKSKCLTANGNRPGDHVIIQDCPSQVTDRTHWKVWENGTIVSRTGLVLSTRLGDKGTKLTVEVNVKGLGQSWRPTVYTKPVDTRLVGLNSLCLQASGTRVRLERCGDKEDQKWYIYPDGSIRPDDNKGNCLFADAKYEVSIVKCDYLSSEQRWEFKSDRTILNAKYNMVLAVAQSNPSVKRIIIQPSTGSPNQKWSSVL